MTSLHEVLQQIESLFSKFNHTFYNDELQKPVITISPDSTGKALGWCTMWRAWKTSEMKENEGFYEINICAEYLNRSLEEISATLLHEMVHLYCLQHDIKDTSRGTMYHNKKFKQVAEEHGLIIEKHEKYGWTKTSLNDIAKEMLSNMENIEFVIFRTKITKPEKASKKSSSRKYVCPTCGVSVRATKEVRIMCQDCDEIMECEE